METDAALREQLRAAERGEAASWLAWSTASWWSPLFFAAWVVAFVLNAGLGDDLGWPMVNVALAFAALGLVLWEKRARGTWPEGSMPRELVAPVTWSMVGYLVLVVGGWVAVLWLDPWLVALVAGVATYLLVLAYGRAYERGCAQVRARLEVTR